MQQDAPQLMLYTQMESHKWQSAQRRNSWVQISDGNFPVFIYRTFS